MGWRAPQSIQSKTCWSSVQVIWWYLLGPAVLCQWCPIPFHNHLTIEFLANGEMKCKSESMWCERKWIRCRAMTQCLSFCYFFFVLRMAVERTNAVLLFARSAKCWLLFFYAFFHDVHEAVQTATIKRVTVRNTLSDSWGAELKAPLKYHSNILRGEPQLYASRTVNECNLFQSGWCSMLILEHQNMLLNKRIISILCISMILFKLIIQDM